MEKKPFNSIHALHQPNQSPSDDCNTAAPLSRPPPSLPAMVPTVINTNNYDDILDNDALYSVYSSRRSNTPPALPPSSRAVEPETTMQTETYEDLMLSEYDMEVHAALLALQLHRSHIRDRYAGVQEPLPAMTYNAATNLDHYNSRVPANPYEFDRGTPSSSTQERRYGRRHDNLAANRGIKQEYSSSRSKVPTNNSFAGDMPPVNSRFSTYSQNTGATTTPRVDPKGNMCSMLLNLLGDTEDLFETMKSKHGNYTFQRLLAVCDEEQKKNIVVRVSQDPRRLVELATDEYGRLSFNKLVDEVSTSQDLCECLMSALSSELLDLMTRPKNGPAVIKYLLFHLQPNNILPIFETALEHFHFLSRDKPGYISLNHCFSKLCKFDYQELPAKDYKWLILMKLIDSSLELAADEFGNFVVQYVIRLGISEYTSMICNKLKDNVHQLSLSKPGSFVLQACLESSGRMIILHALRTFNSRILHHMTMHPYGNYVMQSAMNVLTELPPDDEFVQTMQQFPANLRHNINGRNMVKRK